MLRVAVLFFLSALPLRAHAYLDPGTGSYLLQIALASVLGGLFAARRFWQRIRLFLRRLLSFTKHAAHGNKE